MVSARYYGTENSVLRNVCLTIKPGQTLGIVGRSGAGKSTLVKLIWHYLSPTFGKITIDGIDIASADLEVLRREISIISQDSAIFNGTLRENLSPLAQVLKDSNENKILLEEKEQEMLNYLENLNF